MWKENGCTRCQKPVVIAETPEPTPAPELSPEQMKVITMLEDAQVPQPELVSKLILQGYSDKYIKGEIGHGYSKKIRAIIKALNLN
jgi:hypothetical protein